MYPIPHNKANSNMQMLHINKHTPLRLIVANRSQNIWFYILRSMRYYRIKPHCANPKSRSYTSALSPSSHILAPYNAPQCYLSVRSSSPFQFLPAYLSTICWQSQHSTANSRPRITSHPLNHPTKRPRSSLIVPANNSIPIIPPTTPHNQISLFPAARTHRPTNTPHTTAYRLLPYVAMMFRNILRLGDIT